MLIKQKMLIPETDFLNTEGLEYINKYFANIIKMLNN